MAIIQLSSMDPNFSFVIKKNPSSGMQLRAIRKGMGYGWFSKNDTAYNIFFKDADNAVSYGDQEFEYLNTSRYNSPQFVLNAISEYFSSTVKDIDDKDIAGIEKTLFINMIEINMIRQIKHFEKYFPDFTLTVSRYNAKSYSLTVTTTKTFHELLNYVNLLVVFIVLTGNDFVMIDESTIDKYMSAMERLDTPFFIRYMFSRNLLKSKTIFNKYKDRLENSNMYDSIDMVFGDTAMQRKSKITSLLDFDKSIVDIGCGEGFYALDFAKKLKDRLYHAIDIESHLLSVVENKATKKEITNIKTYNHIDGFLKLIEDNKTETKYDVILTEVMEHMPIEDSKVLVDSILTSIEFDKFIITVPNKDFNQFYMIGEDEFRHLDHKWEPTELEFKELISEIIGTDFNHTFINIGDTVNGISTSIGCVVTKA